MRNICNAKHDYAGLGFFVHLAPADPAAVRVGLVGDPNIQSILGDAILSQSLTALRRGGLPRLCYHCFVHQTTDSLQMGLELRKLPA